MAKCIAETYRRRTKQEAYNALHGLEPISAQGSETKSLFDMQRASLETELKSLKRKVEPARKGPPATTQLTALDVGAVSMVLDGGGDSILEAVPASTGKKTKGRVKAKSLFYIALLQKRPIISKSLSDVSRSGADSADVIQLVEPLKEDGAGVGVGAAGNRGERVASSWLADVGLADERELLANNGIKDLGLSLTYTRTHTHTHTHIHTCTHTCTYAQARAHTHTHTHTFTHTHTHTHRGLGLPRCRSDRRVVALPFVQEETRLVGQGLVTGE